MNQSPRILLLTSAPDPARLRTIESSLGREGLATVHTWTSASLPALNERQALFARRLLLERRRARGWDDITAAVALKSPSVRAWIALANREFDALVLDGSVDRAPLDELLEAKPRAQITPVWMARTEGASTTFGWIDWSHQTSDAQTASALMGAADHLGHLQDRPAVPVLVRFAGGNDPLAAQVERFHQTLAVRCQAIDVPLYSPLFFDQGRLQATRLAAAIRAAIQSDTRLPVFCIPQLQREEFSRRLRSEGGQWLGAWLAGAEHPVLCLDPGAGEAEAATAIQSLIRSLHG